jgi:hypothetical protein
LRAGLHTLQVMLTSNNKWLAHTLLVGLIPVLTRLLMWAAATGAHIQPLAASDFITLGLVVHVSMLNEAGHLLVPDKALRALLNSTCTLFITCYGALYTLSTLGERNAELINVPTVLAMSIALCVASVALGLILFQTRKRRKP